MKHLDDRIGLALSGGGFRATLFHIGVVRFLFEVEGRLPRGLGIERLRDPPTEWSRQFEALGLNPE